MGAGRKLRTHRREQLWADKDYKKSHLGSEWKKPFAGSSHAKGIVLEKMCVPHPFAARTPRPTHVCRCGPSQADRRRSLLVHAVVSRPNSPTPPFVSALVSS